MERLPEFVEARKAFHAELLTSTLTINSAGVVSNADGNNRASVLIAKGIADLLKAETQGERIAGQTSGNQFEGACARFVRTTFLKLGHLRPGIWDVHQVSGRNRLKIARACAGPTRANRCCTPASPANGQSAATARRTHARKP